MSALLVVTLSATSNAQPGEPSPTQDDANKPDAPAPQAPNTQPDSPPPVPPTPVAEPAASILPSALQIHGFASEGGFVSTANDYIGHSSRGSLEFFEVALNVSTEITDKLHAGLQVFSQDEGATNDATPRLDWAYLDYRYKPWLGVRAGRVRIPFGLYNDYIDIDAARLQILLPQSVYTFTDRNILTAQTGFAVYGTHEGKQFGALDYQVYGGALSFPLPPAQDPSSVRIYQSDSKYVVGGHLFWHPPVEGLRVGGSYLRTSLEYKLNLPPALVTTLIMSGQAPADFNGNETLSIKPANLWVASAEYVHGDWLLAAEYSRWRTHTTAAPINLLPTPDGDSERFYGLVTYRLSAKLDSGVYYSVLNADANDRGGTTKLPQRFLAWSRDAAASIRYDVNDHWLWKLEAHFIDGAAAIDATVNPTPQRYWGLFLLRTTVTF